MIGENGAHGLVGDAAAGVLADGAQIVVLHRVVVGVELELAAYRLEALGFQRLLQRSLVLDLALHGRGLGLGCDGLERVGGSVAVLGVDYSDPDPSLALAFAQQSGWTYPHVTDPLRQTAGPIRFTGIPVTIFVDAQGRIVYRTIGAVGSTQQLVDATQQYLGVAL